MAKNKRTSRRADSRTPGQLAQAEDHSLRSVTVGCLPILNRILDRMNLQEILGEHLAPEGPRTKLPTKTALLVLLRNLLMSREPIYGVGEWAAQYAPELLDVTVDQLNRFNDDRLGRCLDRLFKTEQSDLVMDVVRHVVKEFSLNLDELHNDSTTVSFFGAYNDADTEMVRGGRRTVAITYGHSKDHRPDLKQLLYILTVTDDGGVPVFFTTKSGNVVDDQTHRETWDLLCDLVGRKDFLYVADCKLATTDNMKYIHRKGGRFISVLPATRKEDHKFRERLSADPNSIHWDLVYLVYDDNDDSEEREVVDQLSVCREETLTKEKYRLWWFHSTRKANLDRDSRLRRVERAISELNRLHNRLLGPRPRLRTKEDVQPVVDEILKKTGTTDLLRVEVRQRREEWLRQVSPGRPGKDTKYVKEVTRYCHLTWDLDTQGISEAEKGDGVFPLITNTRDMSAEEVLRAYKRQPIIEKRFSQLKTDFEVAPVYLKSVPRIQAMLCLYFFTLMVQTLLERELRQAMERAKEQSLPMYPEGRPCKRPTARRIIDIFEPVQRHTLRVGTHSQTLVTELTQLQRQILTLLGMRPQDYAR